MLAGCDGVALLAMGPVECTCVPRSGWGEGAGVGGETARMIVDGEVTFILVVRGVPVVNAG